ncbi:hypothetical protein [Sphingopyxis sp. NFH-91]|uniref:hypothetical protein n=1 Tax=Sphingopyxis sp. NFH-91 TaxID=2744457 RepID=UPI001F348117|nr:hypothetical protein [Sphingopyxis sp. NFH-91]
MRIVHRTIDSRRFGNILPGGCDQRWRRRPLDFLALIVFVPAIFRHGLFCLAFIGVLNAQARELHLDLQAARDGSLHTIRADAQTVLDSLMAVASEHAKAIVDAFASIEAVAVGMRCGATEASAARKAVDGLTDGGALLRYNRTLPVRPEIVAMIEALSDKGPAVRVTKLTEITAP